MRWFVQRVKVHILIPKTFIWLNLKPSEELEINDYFCPKAKVIAEICGRAISFWTYQMHQECCYQEIAVKEHSRERNDSNENRCKLALCSWRMNFPPLKNLYCGFEQAGGNRKEKEADLLDQWMKNQGRWRKLQLLCDSLRKKISLKCC